MRVSGTMEFRHPHRAVIPQRVEAIVVSAGPLLDGVRWDERSNVWVGAHPVTRIPKPDLGMKATIGGIFATPDKTPQDISEVAAAGDAYIDDYLELKNKQKVFVRIQYERLSEADHNLIGELQPYADEWIAVNDEGVSGLLITFMQAHEEIPWVYVLKWAVPPR